VRPELRTGHRHGPRMDRYSGGSHHRRWPADLHASGGPRHQVGEIIPGGASFPQKTPGTKLIACARDGTARANRPDRDDARADEPARHPGPATTVGSGPRWRPLDVRPAGSNRTAPVPPFATLPHQRSRGPPWICSRQVPSNDSTNYCHDWCRPRQTARLRRGPAPQRRALPQVAPSRDRACSPSNWPPTPKPPPPG